MGEKLIIALNREYGSGGKEIAEKLSKRLGMHVYDEEIAGLAAKHSGIRQDYFEKVDEKPTDSFLYMLAMNTLTMNSSMNPFDNTLSSDRLFNKQAEVIKEIAEKEDCIIIGRCAGYILREEPKCVKIYLTADKDFRAQRIMASDHLDEKEALKKIHSMDKKRDSYFGYYAGQDWKASNTYDLTISTSALGIDKAVELICQYIALKFN
jgi:cytidylate kinase